jgi:hypothetical protein
MGRSLMLAVLGIPLGGDSGGGGVVNAIGTPELIDQQEQTGSGTSSIALTVPAGGVPEGRIVLVWGSNGNNLTGITDTGGNTYALDLDENDGAGRRIQVWSAPVTTPLAEGGTITGSYVGFTGAKRLVGLQVTGLHAIPEDASDGAAGTGTAASTDAFVTTAANTLLLAGFLYTNTGTFEPTAPYAEMAELGSSAVKLAVAYQIVTSAGSQQAAGTLGTSGDWLATAIALKAA